VQDGQLAAGVAVEPRVEAQDMVAVDDDYLAVGDAALDFSRREQAGSVHGGLEGGCWARWLRAECSRAGVGVNLFGEKNWDDASLAAP
jgi:hypothetical protein